ncbi:MAG: hypothetical protein U9N76_00495 [Candidatus Marinimicrobia bacterium]|nr:hypothetical protein [Candidatus Neomarinimicrobiota bacterium]
MKKYLLTILLFLIVFTFLTGQPSVISFSGTSSDSAKITITSDGSGGNAYFCPDSFYVGNYASLTGWGKPSICIASYSGPGKIYLGFIDIDIKIYLEGAY